MMGARGDFLSNYLWNPNPIESYVHKSCNYIKFHTHNDNLAFDPSIFIDYDMDSNEMITLFMWDKTVKKDFESIDEFENFTKIYFTMLDSWIINQAMRKDEFTHKLNFRDLFDEDFMINFFLEVNGTAPSDYQIKFLQQDNKKQQTEFAQKIKLHSTRIAHKIFEFEKTNGLTDNQRLWSIVDLWKQYRTPSGEFLTTLDKYLDLQHYSK